MRTRPAMTMLELILAITILASITALIAALWGQSRDWARDSTEQFRAVRLQRVLELMRAQWDDRRAAIAPKAGAVVSAAALPNSVEFYTATPIIFTDWPLVRAAYRIEVVRGFDGAPDTYDLVYEEYPLRRAEQDAALDRDGGRDPAQLTTAEQVIDDQSRGGAAGSDGLVRLNGRGVSNRLVLLQGCAQLKFERFGALGTPVERLGVVRTGERSEGERRRGDVDPIDAQWKWREYDKPIEEQIPVVRLVGEYQMEPFACILVVNGL